MRGTGSTIKNIKLIARLLACMGSRDNDTIAHYVYWNHIKHVSALVIHFNVIN